MPRDLVGVLGGVPRSMPNNTLLVDRRSPDTSTRKLGVVPLLNCGVLWFFLSYYLRRYFGGSRVCEFVSWSGGHSVVMDKPSRVPATVRFVTLVYWLQVHVLW